MPGSRTSPTGELLSGVTARLGWAPAGADARLLQQHLDQTVQRYGVAAVVLVGAAPLVYTVARLAAHSRRPALVELASRAEERGGAHVVAGGGGGGCDGGSSSPPPAQGASPLATGRTPRRAAPSSTGGGGSTTVASVMVSYANEQTHAYRFVNGHSEGVQPIARAILANQRAADSEFAGAVAVSASAQFLRVAGRWLARSLVLDVAVHLCVFGLCAVIDGSCVAAPSSESSSSPTTSPPPSSSSSSATSPGSAQGNGGGSLLSALVSTVGAACWGMLLGLGAQRLFSSGSSGSSGVGLSAYGLYDFAYSAPTPFESCCLPRWLVPAVHSVYGLAWMGRPRNPSWGSAAAARGDVWRGLTAKGYFVYFLLLAVPRNSVRVGVESVGRCFRIAQWRSCKATKGTGGGPSPRPAGNGNSSSLSSTPVKQRSSGGGDSVTTPAAAVAAAPPMERPGLSASRANRATTTASSSSSNNGGGGIFCVGAVVWALRRGGPAHAFITAAVADISSALCGYAVATTLTALDGILGGSTTAGSAAWQPMEREEGTLLTFLRTGGGLCFNVLGYVYGAHQLQRVARGTSVQM